MALYEIEKNSSGVPTGNYKYVAGRGKAEYGASTVRTGTIAQNTVINANSVYVYSATFSSPMPDTDYCIDISFVNQSNYMFTYEVRSKTVDGFSILIGRPFSSNMPANSITINYKAYKLYTDTEYNNILAAMPSDASASNKLMTRAQSGAILPLVNLGTEYTAELKADISSGKFEKAVVGGYLTINGHVYYFAHPDYWLHTGDTECTTHHMLVIPADNIGTGKMNSSNITTGGYARSDIKTGNNSNTALAAARAQIIADFGAANILTHRELFTTAVTDGKASNWAWADSDVDLMNEVMVYGCNAWGSHPGYETGIDKCQLKLFQERPDLITTRSYWWLRGVVSAAHFAIVDSNGYASDAGASYALGVRPAFAIIG